VLLLLLLTGPHSPASTAPPFQIPNLCDRNLHNVQQHTHT
jgi:hypothetical protein